MRESHWRLFHNLFGRLLCDGDEAGRHLTAQALPDQVEPARVLRLYPEHIDEAVDLVGNQDVPVDHGKEPGDLPAGRDALDLAEVGAVICEVSNVLQKSLETASAGGQQ